MAIQFKVTIEGPENAVANDAAAFRGWLKSYTGNSGSPAVKNLYQAGKIVAYPQLTVTENGTGVDNVRPVCTMLYEFDSALSREQFIHNSHEWGAEAIEYRNILQENNNFVITGVSIDT